MTRAHTRVHTHTTHAWRDVTLACLSLCPGPEPALEAGHAPWPRAETRPLAEADLRSRPDSGLETFVNLLSVVRLWLPPPRNGDDSDPHTSEPLRGLDEIPCVQPSGCASRAGLCLAHGAVPRARQAAPSRPRPPLSLSAVALASEHRLGRGQARSAPHGEEAAACSRPLGALPLSLPLSKAAPDPGGPSPSPPGAVLPGPSGGRAVTDSWGSLCLLRGRGPRLSPALLARGLLGPRAKGLRVLQECQP